MSIKNGTYFDETEDVLAGNKLACTGKPGDHVIFARHFEDGSGPSTWGFDSREEIEWAIGQLEAVLEASER